MSILRTEFYTDSWILPVFIELLVRGIRLNGDDVDVDSTVVVMRTMRDGYNEQQTSSLHEQRQLVRTSKGAFRLNESESENFIYVCLSFIL